MLQAGRQKISDAMMMSKGITLLEKTGVFKEDIQEWRRQSADLKTWEKYKLVFHRAHQDHKRAVTTAGKRGYTVMVQNIYGETPPLQKSTMRQ